ncbi:hypothetical protein Agabi119p4_3799 [Agaricus bisporus var. burnettii]|uniref:PPM-type phosphatase domain-containing protein n=1 Tax=Agaricus bisporus var. burnettii TaxID=192524 RepID=A0A8H7KIG5_AGABI|nr:hypothetical protein Agabi119p4_3799 [Agaricus bisporus var. burnettii]
MAWVTGRRSLLFLTGVASFGGSLYYRETNNRADNHQDDACNIPSKRTFDSFANHIWSGSPVDERNDKIVTRYSSAYLANKGIGFCSLGFHRIELAPQQNWTFGLLSEGFRGWETSAFIFRALIPTICAVLSLALGKNASRPGKEDLSTEPEPPITSEKIDMSIRKAFLDVDHGVVDQAPDMIISSPSQALNMVQLSAAVSGSTGMLAVYDESRRILKVANVGDARAVLGRKALHENGMPCFEVHVLSSEHTSSNPSELARLQESHSDTDIKVLQEYVERDITRAFGLAMCKWSQSLQDRIYRDYLGESPLVNLLPRSTSDPENQQQPYLNAEPDIRTIHVRPGDFLVMASKGVWDSLANEEVIGLVGVWLARQNCNPRTPISHPSLEKIYDQNMLPVKFPEKWEDTTTWYQKMKIQKKYICVDTNVAAHLVRNALGGANQAFTEGVLRLPYPLSANSRGELAVMVLQFE